MVETVDKWRTASMLDHHWGLGEREGPLRVLVQVNTSGEPSEWNTSSLRLMLHGAMCHILMLRMVGSCHGNCILPQTSMAASQRRAWSWLTASLRTAST